jgi:UDP-glucose 4-epimerase
MKDCSVLVVGGAGYIGAHMVGVLLKAKFKVITLDNLSTGHRELHPGGLLIEGSLGDAKLLDNIFSTQRIDAVMHFAAYSLVGESVADPLKYYRNNLAATTELLDAMKRHNINRFIFSSTAAVYGEPNQVPISEDHPCAPTNPYGATKLAVERMLQDCAAAHNLKFMALRYFNAAGADESGKLGERHEPETHLIPLILKVATAEREHVKIFGTDYPTPDGTCIRDYIHVGDLAQAHLLALDALLSGKDSGIYNLGNSRGYSVRQVIEAARRVTGHEIPAVESDPRSGDPAILVADSAKIREELGWQPRFEDLENMIQSAWDWHQFDKVRGHNVNTVFE